MSVRKAQKEATRQRVLAAAHQLFESEGYEETTVRAIATRAGVSVGSVFTAFPSKLDILSEVMRTRLEALYAELDRIGPSLRGSTPDRLRSLFAIFFAFESQRRRLFLAHIAAAYAWRPGSEAAPFGRNERLNQVVHGCLARGVAAGDVDPGLDLDDVVEALLAIYAWTYRLAAWEGADAEALSRAMDRQIGLLAGGLTPRAGASPLI
ncbi:MAG: TetR/AcrR family transcriptional regulator [Phenylobacterium sp.]